MSKHHDLSPLKLMAGPCDRCHAGCCRSYHLFINGYDALRLARDLGVPIGEFATLMSFTEAQAARYADEYLPLRFTDRDPDLRFLLALKRVESQVFPGTKRCQFLIEWTRETPVSGREGHPGRDVVGRCGVYGSRPLICQTYPTGFHLELPLGIISDPPKVEVNPWHDAHTLCAEPWTTESFGLAPDVVLHRLAVQKYEREFYNKLCAEFNESGLVLENFLPFMQRVYEQRFRSASSLTEAK